MVKSIVAFALLGLLTIHAVNAYQCFECDKCDEVKSDTLKCDSTKAGQPTTTPNGENTPSTASTASTPEAKADATTPPTTVDSSSSTTVSSGSTTTGKPSKDGFCFIIKYKTDKDEVITKRGCSAVDCKAMTLEKDAECDTCTEDECNGNAAGSISSWTLTTVLIVAITKVFLN